MLRENARLGCSAVLGDLEQGTESVRMWEPRI